METFLQQLTLVNLFFRQLGAWLIIPMQLITELGSEMFFLILVPLLYWVVDAAIGLRIGAMLILSNMTNHLFKVAMHQPRPFWVNADVVPMAEESSFGIPSGHSQNAMSIWGLLAHSFRQRWLTVVAALLILLTGISRLYLGVHFLTDVVLGWLIGAILLWLFIRYQQPIVRWFQTLNAAGQYAVAAASALIPLALSWTIISLNSTWQPPAEWLTNYNNAYHGLPFAPFSIKTMVNLSALWLGMLTSLIYLWRHNRMHQPFGNPGVRVLQFLIGMLGIILIWAGLDKLFPDGETLIALIFRFIRYGLLGVWVVALAPMLFKKIFRRAEV